MNKLKSVTDFRLTISLIILSIATIATFVIAISVNNSPAHAASGPVFNKLAQEFPIVTDKYGTVENVSSSGGLYEHNFVRVGEDWKRRGNYVNGGNNLEVCEDGKVINVWVYAHNTISTKYNHNNPALLDFQGPAVAKNATVSLNVDNLNGSVYATSHSITGTVSADNASSKSDAARVYCNDRKIRLVSEDMPDARVASWSNESINRNRHDRAKAVFNADYGIINAGNIFGSGAKVGYNGNLPACRYYAAYVKVQLKVIVEPEEVKPIPEPIIPTGSVEPTPVPPPEVPVTPEVPNTGSVSDTLSYSLIGLVAGLALTVAFTQRAMIARARRNR